MTSFNFHQYDCLTTSKADPCNRHKDKTGLDVYMLLLAAYKGDIDSLVR